MCVCVHHQVWAGTYQSHLFLISLSLFLSLSPVHTHIHICTQARVCRLCKASELRRKQYFGPANERSSLKNKISTHTHKVFRSWPLPARRCSSPFTPTCGEIISFQTCLWINFFTQQWHVAYTALPAQTKHRREWRFGLKEEKNLCQIKKKIVQKIIERNSDVIINSEIFLPFGICKVLFHFLMFCGMYYKHARIIIYNLNNDWHYGMYY